LDNAGSFEVTSTGGVVILLGGMTATGIKVLRLAQAPGVERESQRDAQASGSDPLCIIGLFSSHQDYGGSG
jgi:hypothetical protein